MEKTETRESVILINENEKIFSVFHKPLNTSHQTNKFPAILVCHGFAGQKTGRYRLYVTLAEELAKQGIAVLRIDFRGCGDSEGDFLNTTLKGEVSDALTGLKFLSEHPDVDAERIGVFGRSLGGAVAVLAAKEYTKVKSLALWAPMFSAKNWQDKWTLLKKSNLSQDQMQEKMVMNGQLIGFEFLNQLFDMQLELELALLKNTPLLHINAEKDQIVTAEHVINYKKARENAINSTEFISLEKSDHDFSNTEERIKALKKTVSWFKKTL